MSGMKGLTESYFCRCVVISNLRLGVCVWLMEASVTSFGEWNWRYLHYGHKQKFHKHVRVRSIGRNVGSYLFIMNGQINTRYPVLILTTLTGGEITSELTNY